MADPLSLAASIAGLISLADVAFKYTFKFVRATKDAKSDVSTLADEINNVGSILRVLEALASDLETEGDQFDPTLRNHYLNHCFRTLSRIETKAKKATQRFARSKVESIYQQLKWPFSSSETKDLLAELSRHKETINMALAADSMRKLQLLLTKTEKLGEDISSIEKIVKRIEINTLIDVDAQKQHVLDYFMKTNPQRNLETSIRLRHAMTGLWLTESPDFFRWLDTPGSKLWLTGIPGAGKTVLAGSVIQEALSRSSHDVGVAFFFCDYKDPETWSTSNILGAVANQLARQKKEAFDILNLYYDELHLPGHLAESPDPDELRARIGQMSDLLDQSIIIIDGLDECGDFTDEIVDVLIQLTEDSENISLAVFSRDHHNIRIHLETEFEIVPIAARTNDIQLYLGAELDRRIRTRKLQLTTPKMKEEIQEVLVSRAEGM
jgi:Cdc6-like AAA superfamily ATPase